MRTLRSPHRRPTTLLKAAALASVAGLVLSACGGGADGAADDKGVTTIRYQSYAGSVDPLQLADALGYLKGIELKKVGDVTGGPQSLQALASHQVDIGGSAFFGAIAQTVATGVPIKAVFPSYGSNGKAVSGVIVKEGSGITEAEDLIGKKIAVNTLGANAEAILDTWFEHEGLSKEQQDKITLVPLPPLNTPQALKEGQVDAAYLSAQAIANTKKIFPVTTIVSDVDVVGGPYSGGAVTLRDEFIEKQPDTAKVLVTGYAKAVTFIETHEKQEIYDVLFPWLDKHGYSDDKQTIETNFLGTLGVPTAKPTIKDHDIAIWLDWLKSRGDVDAGSIDTSDVFTNEFNPYA
jgi:ABC-type nitrate/sulfonate/bicarbonate transport system substrate-binding protein